MHTNDPSFSATRPVAWLFLAVAVYMAVLATLPALMSPPRYAWVMSEQGPFEQFSIAFWLLCGGLVLWRVRPLNPRSGAMAIVFLAFAGREAELHKAFTADSMLKSNYYRHADAALLEKVLAGAVALALIAALVYVALVVGRFLFRHGGLMRASGQLLALSAGILVLTKMLDRAPAVLANDFAVQLSPALRAVFGAWEEGLEAAAPLMAAAAVWLASSTRTGAGLFDGDDGAHLETAPPR